MKTENQHIIYSRVSTTDQNVEQQTELLKSHYPATKIYEDKSSGANLDRVEFNKMVSELKSGDTVYVYDISRLARNTVDALTITDEFKSKGVRLVVHTLSGVDITSTHGKMVLTVLASVATMQREEMLEKQRIGIERAQKEGKYKGKQANPKTIEACENVYKHEKDKSLSIAKALVAHGVSRGTYYKWKKSIL
ncbi:hypothetical protein BCU85_17345 [Vibrio lentus]|uniref:recombinase family protein n=1 Tax=Vibrio lentus TaxID=136468 RepID=UPI000C859D3E|nr:recombinase family protein [Vibrio lentus]MCC4818025.1 recombinase family protein [Vibrio lentus]PMG72962.1 hypothetical protein BCU85_17345 [Vibrio lentus]PMK89924.1 hypothetical protein BCT88_21380 [Vibrio lentus]PML25474.1 hypothetical protein BCT80_19490 [Vibrio lentus]PMM27952.1 hypothetical protein BCT57_15825 [Vibrio lentus]